jgi:hypothetical protein
MERTTRLFERNPMSPQSGSGFHYVICSDVSGACLQTTSKTVSAFARGRCREWNRLRLTKRCSELSGGVAFAHHDTCFRQPAR